MKGKLLLGLALTSMISASAFAMEIHNGKLLKHKEWTTGNLIGTSAKKFSKAEVLKFKENLKLNGVAISDHMTMSYSMANATTGVAGERADVNGVQFAFLLNDSEGTQVYSVFNSICAATSDKTTECMFYQDEIMLDAQGYAFDLQQPSIQPIFNANGSYNTTVMTVIAVEDERYNGFVAESVSQSSGVVIISSGNTKQKV